MTFGPEDLERIRAHYTKGGNFLAYAEADVLALADALEASWAELEAFRDSGLFEMWTQDRDRAERAEAALDRVRALCDEARDGWSEGGAFLAERIIVTLDGGAE